MTRRPSGRGATRDQIPTTDATSDERLPHHGPGSVVSAGNLHQYGDRSSGDRLTFYVLGILCSGPPL